MIDNVFVVEDNYKKWLISGIITGILTAFIFVISLGISALIMPEKIDVYTIGAVVIMQIGFLPLLIFPLYTFLQQWYPVYRVKCLISSELIVFNIQDRIFYQILWKDIERIEFIEEPYAVGLGHTDTFKIRFFTSSNTQDIRLFALRFSVKNTELIFSKIEELSRILEKDFKKIFNSYIIIKIKKRGKIKKRIDGSIFHKQYEDQQDILRFYKAQ